MKTSKKGGLIAGIILLALLAGGLGAFMVFALTHFDGFNFSFGSFGESDNLALEKEFSFEEIKSIKTESDVTNIRVIRNDDTDKVKVRILAESNITVSADQNNNELNVTVKHQCHFICFNTKTSVAEITLPSEYDGSFTISSDTGNIEVGDFEKTSFDVKTDTGNKKFGTVKSLTIDSDTGNVEIKSAEYIHAKKDTGNLKIGDCTGKLYIDSDTGNVEIEELHLTENSTILKDTGNLTIRNVGDVFVDAQNDVGDKNINGGNRKSNITLEIKSDVGNIDIN